MIPSISEIVRRFKQEWTNQLDDRAIEQVCREKGMTWRQTVLTPIVTIKVFFLQVLHGNTACVGTCAIWPTCASRAQPTARPGCGFLCRCSRHWWSGPQTA